ncbi:MULTISPECIES: Crp/Fnr family transcriptional regulator [unclassified Nocardiopsis]|uniref:Crp/Fnr family transcriptional regulator n=1 Tax=unclassified Nocardiopsis TaxID=2649073 RepID=UPI00135C4EE5|nr:MULTISPECIES: Crp/Fnr family transcriptional regulator [unclassified Nocardiopsis]
MADYGCLSETALFQDLSPAEMDRFAARAPARPLRTAQVVRAPHETVEALYVVKRGRVRLYRILEDGRTVTTAIAGPDAVFGHMPWLGLRMGGSWAEAVEDGLLCVMGRDDVRHLLLSNPRAALRVAEQLGARLADLEQRLADTMYKSVAERTATTLCTLVDPVGSGHGPITVRLTHEQLARLTGTTRERTTRALSELAKRGLLRPRRGRLLVLDRPGLALFADGGLHSTVEPVRQGTGS